MEFLFDYYLMNARSNEHLSSVISLDMLIFNKLRIEIPIRLI